MNDSKKASAIRIAVALGAVYLIWGSTYLAIRFAIETIPPFLMAAARYLTAGSLLYAWSRFRGAPRPKLVHWRSALLLGALLLLAGNGGVVWAEQRVSSGLAALLVSTEPLWIVLMVWLRDRRQKPGGRVIAGLVLGFTGLVLLVRPSGSGGINLLAVAAVLVASLCWAYGSLYSQRAKLPDAPQLSTAMQMLCGGSWLLLAGLFTGETPGFALRSRRARCSPSPTWWFSVPSSPSPLMSGCCARRRPCWSRPTPTSIPWWPFSSAGPWPASRSRRGR